MEHRLLRYGPKDGPLAAQKSQRATQGTDTGDGPRKLGKSVFELMSGSLPEASKMLPSGLAGSDSQLTGPLSEVKVPGYSNLLSGDAM